jgi:hypothetical protein
VSPTIQDVLAGTDRPLLFVRESITAAAAKRTDQSVRRFAVTVS